MKKLEALHSEMLKELFEFEEPCFDSMCNLAECYLKPKIARWCGVYGISSHLLNISEIMQNVHLLLIRRSLDRFFFLNREVPNTDYTEFIKWITVVGKNAVRKFAEKLRATQHESIYNYDYTVTEERDEISARIEQEDASIKLAKIIDCVISLRAGVHKQLIWLLHCLQILITDTKRSLVIAQTVEEYHDKPLSELYKDVLKSFNEQSVVSLTEKQKLSISKMLDAKHEETDIALKDVKLSEFFSTETEKNGAYVVSDWIYKINISIRKRIGK